MSESETVWKVLVDNEMCCLYHYDNVATENDVIRRAVNDVSVVAALRDKVHYQNEVVYKGNGQYDLHIRSRSPQEVSEQVFLAE